MERTSLGCLHSTFLGSSLHLMFPVCKPRFQAPQPHELGPPSLARPSLDPLPTSLPPAFGTRGYWGGRLCASPSCHSIEPPVVDKQQCAFRLSRGLPRYHRAEPSSPPRLSFRRTSVLKSWRFRAQWGRLPRYRKPCGMGIPQSGFS